MVSKLPSLGTTQRILVDVGIKFALVRAVVLGFVDVVRVLINEGGIRAV